MLSRVARNIYWLARYLERAENTARLVNVHSNLLLDLPKTLTVGWEPLIDITGSEAEFYQRYGKADELSVVKFLVEDKEHFSSIVNSISAARENLRTTRDIIPREAWEQVNDLQLWTRRQLALGLRKSVRYDFLRQVIRNIQQITGLLYGAMSRDLAYDFLLIGRYLERADMTTRIIDVRSANLLLSKDGEDEPALTPFTNIQWMSVLKSLTAYQMYRQHTGMVRVSGADVLKFLLQDGNFPRTLSYSLAQVEGCLKRMPRNAAALNSLNKLNRRIADADVSALAHVGLHEFIDELQVGMGWVHTHVDETYFSGKLN